MKYKIRSIKYVIGLKNIKKNNTEYIVVSITVKFGQRYDIFIILLENHKNGLILIKRLLV